MIPDLWLNSFDEHLKKFFGIDHHDAGLSDEHLLRYTDLEPREAALVYGEDYDLDRIDRGF